VGHPIDVLELSGVSSQVAMNASSIRRLSDWLGPLAPGPHAFGLQEKTSTPGVGVTFGAMSIVIQPL
jgi:hypothetical protein